MNRLISTLLGGTSVVVLSTFSTQAGSLPSGGHFAEGHGSIAKANQSLTVKQSSTTGIIDWNGFSIGKHAGVTFDNGKGATLNRVTGGNLSIIAGSLHATGSLYLLNSSGVIVSNTGRVVTGGSFVASSGALSDEAFDSNKRDFATAPAKVINHGSITSGGETKLVGSSVGNTGTIQAADVRLRAATGEAFAGGAIHASGVRNARILIIADNGTTKIAGDIHATKRDGAGGEIETSGRSVSISGKIDAGHGGTWLVDPENLIIHAASATDIENTLNDGTDVTLQTTATGTSGHGTVKPGPGNIQIDAAISWDTHAKLTLDAYHSVQISDPISVTGNGRVSLTTDDGGTGGLLQFLNGADMRFTNLGSALAIDGTSYVLVKDIATLASDIASDPSGDYALAKSYDASAHTYAKSPIGTVFTGTFEGLGNTISNLTIDETAHHAREALFADIGAGGAVNDLSLTNVSISASYATDTGALAATLEGSLSGDSATGQVTGNGESGGGNGDTGGLVGQASSTASVTNATASVTVQGGTNLGGLIGENAGAVTASSTSGTQTDDQGTIFGGLIGLNSGTVTDSSSSDKLSCSGGDCGGLIGSDTGTISHSFASGDVTCDDDCGGLVGEEAGSISDSYTTGAVSGTFIDAGGLVGYAAHRASITDSYTTGTMTDASGLVGTNSGTIDDDYTTGVVEFGSDAPDSRVSGKIHTPLGGLVGVNNQSGIVENSHSSVSINNADGGGTDGGLVSSNFGTITNSFATGNITSTNAGGLVGYNRSTGTVTNSYATGSVTATGAAGGLVGESEGAISNSHASGSVEGQEAGGLAGTGGNITNCYATGSVTVDGTYDIAGGLVGRAGGTITGSYATGNVSGSSSYYLGGLFGELENGTVKNDYATGSVSGGTNTDVGGLIGWAENLTISSSYSTGAVSGGAGSYVGGFIGYLDGANSLSTPTTDYWDTDTSGKGPHAGVGNVKNAGGVTGLTTTQLQSGLPSGFDSSVWAEDASINNGLPYLIALKSSY